MRPCGVDREVVGLVEPFAVVRVGEHGERAVVFDAADAAERRLAHDEAALAVEEQAVGAGVLAIDGLLAVAVAAIDVAAAAGEQAELGMPGRAFAGTFFLEAARAWHTWPGWCRRRGLRIALLQQDLRRAP